MAAYQNPRAVQQKFEDLHAQLQPVPDRLAAIEGKLDSIEGLKATLASIEAKLDRLLSELEPEPTPSRSGRGR